MYGMGNCGARWQDRCDQGVLVRGSGDFTEAGAVLIERGFQPVWAYAIATQRPLPAATCPATGIALKLCSFHRPFEQGQLTLRRHQVIGRLGEVVDELVDVLALPQRRAGPVRIEITPVVVNIKLAA